MVKTNAQLDALRNENVELKTTSKQQSLLLQNPFTIPTVRTAIVQQQQSLRGVDIMRRAIAEEISKQSGVLKVEIHSTKQVINKLKTRFEVQLEDLAGKYRAESLQRKLLYNKVQELKGNIRVFCRCRFDNREKQIFQFPSTTEIMVPSTQNGQPKLMEFDRVYDMNTTQETVFEETKPTILSVVDGYNVCIIAYGQTGSGKVRTFLLYCSYLISKP